MNDPLAAHGALWKDDFATAAPAVEGGDLVFPMTPGRGAGIIEEAVGAHPPKQPR